MKNQRILLIQVALKTCVLKTTIRSGECSTCFGKACIGFLHPEVSFHHRFFQYHTEDRPMTAGPEGQEVVIRKELWENRVCIKEECDKYVFTNCRNVEPKELWTWTNPRSPDWQIGFFDADGEVYFDEIVLQYDANFSSIVRNYWWSGKEGNEKKEGYYSLIKSVKKLRIQEEHVDCLLDYVEGRYEVGEWWQIHELDRTIELRIECEVEETTVERLLKYFDNIQCNWITADLKTENNIIYSCSWYQFRNCEGVVPQKLVVNAKLMDGGALILFEDADGEVHIPEITIDEQGCFAAIVRNTWKDGKEDYREKYGYYSLVQYVETLTIKNNSEALKDFANYMAGKYVIGNVSWKLQQLSRDIRVIIEKPGDASAEVSKIRSYFNEVIINGKRQLYQEVFKNLFSVYRLFVEQPERHVEATEKLTLDGYYNIRKSMDRIRILTIKQKLSINQFVCFHDIEKAVTVDKIVIEENGDLRNMLQNAYYSNGQAGFFSLLETAKKLEIGNNLQAVGNLADYIDGKYALHPKWEILALDKDMEIKINVITSLNIAITLRNCFKNVSIDCIWTPLETENVIDQDCEYQYIFGNCRDANPQKLVVNAKLEGNGILILFDNADNEVCIPEITIGEHGSFDAIVRDYWRNCKYGSERKRGYYSLVSHVETLIIQNNLEAVCDLADYIGRNYEIKWLWSIQKLDKNIKVRIENIDVIQSISATQNKVKKVKKIKEYFDDVTVGGHQFQFLDTGLRTTGLNNALEARAELTLAEGVYNVENREHIVNSLTVDQELETDQLVYFHGFNAPASINAPVIKENGNLRNATQNAYYNKDQIGFFSPMETANALETHDNSKATTDFVDYVECEYNLNQNWKTKLLDKSTKVITYCYKNVISAIHRLQKYFSTVQHNIQADALVQKFWKDDMILMDCSVCYFINCQNITPRYIFINGKVVQKIVGFCDTDHEVHIPHITIASSGEFSSIVYNFNSWNNREEKYYSLINHIKTLKIEENNQAVSDLARYIKRQYDLNECWKYGVVHRDIKIIINNYSGCAIALNFLLNNINEVIVNGSPGIQYVTAYKNAFQEHITQHYKGLEFKDIACSTQYSKQLELLPDVYHITEYDVQIDQLVVRQQINENQFICFHGAQQKPKIHKIVMDENGCLRTILQNMLWCNGKSNLFSLIACCEVLTFWDNSRALKDLADYVEKRYQLNWHWECETIDKTIKLETSATGDDIPVIKKLKMRFSSVSIRDLSISVQPTTVIDEPCEKCTFIQEKHIKNSEEQKLSLIINAAVSDDIIMSNEEIKFSDMTIGPHGKLENIIYNCYENGNNLVRYSILSNVDALTIQNNQDAIKCLAMYVNGRYQLMQGWSIENPSEDTYIRIQHAKVQDEMNINQIKNYFITVAVEGVRIPLADKNMIDTSFINYTFMNCKDTKPKTLFINAPLRDNVIRFTQADKPVCIPKIQIGSNGSIRCVVHNQWGEDDQTPLEFSLLAFAKELTIINNQQAIKDFLAYVIEYQGKSKAMRPNKNMWVRMTGFDSSYEISKLADYFGLVSVNNRIVLSSDKNISKECINEHNQYLRELRKQIDNKRKGIFDKEMRIRNQLEKAKQRYRRRRLRFQEYLALAE